MKGLKGASSRAINQECPEIEGRFRWQGTFGVFAVERESLPRIIRYIDRQVEHHQNGTTEPYFETMYVTSSIPSPES